MFQSGFLFKIFIQNVHLMHSTTWNWNSWRVMFAWSKMFAQYCCLIHRILTNMCTQCVHMMPIITVPRPPNNRPAFLNAMGIAKIPVPKDDFNRCANAPIVLRIKEIYVQLISSSCEKAKFFSQFRCKKGEYKEEKVQTKTYVLACVISLCSNGL